MISTQRNLSKAKLLRWEGCSCHNSKQDRRLVKRSMKAREQREWQSEVSDEKDSALLEHNMYEFSDDSDPWWLTPYESPYDTHVYEGERCVYCNSNVYDNMIYGDAGCIPNRAPMVYTGESTP